MFSWKSLKDENPSLNLLVLHYFVSLHPRWNGTTGDVRRGLPTDPDKPVGGFGAGFSSSAGGKG